MTLKEKRQIGAIIAGVILLSAVMVGLVGARPAPVIHSDTNPVVRGVPFILSGANFQGHQTVRLVLSDGQTRTLNTSGGHFSATFTTTTTLGTLHVDAYDGATGELLARTG